MFYNSKKLRQFNKRVIVSGKVLELYEYEKPVSKGFTAKHTGCANAVSTTKEVKAENRKKVAQRACAHVRNMINANSQLNKFLTLTFAQNITDIKFARYEFEKFIKRLKTKFKRFQYIVVIEFQERGAIHFHLLCNIPYIDVNKLSKIWRHGFIKLNRIDNVDNVGAYVTKYMTKDNIDERLIGKKCYSMSKGLNKYREYTDEAAVTEILENVESVKRIYTSEFENEYYGKISYTQIICYTPLKPPSAFERMERLRVRLIPLPADTPTPFA